MKVKGRMYGREGSYSVDLDIHRSWSIIESDIYKTKKLAKVAAERLAKKLNLEIEWNLIQARKGEK